MFWQRDPKWANQRLGTCNGSTIGSSGCYLTCLVEILKKYGYQYTPKSLDDYFTRRAYINGCLLNENILPEYFPAFELLNVYHFEHEPAKLEVLNKTCNEEIIICLDFDHNPSNGVSKHFVLLNSYDVKEIIIDDPWTGKKENFKVNYGDRPEITIIKVIKYRYVNSDLEFLVKNGLVSSPEYWYPKLHEPMPAWAVFALLKRIIEGRENDGNQQKI